MATKTIVQNNVTPQLSSISLMLDYDIDNTLNILKENGQILGKMAKCFSDNIDCAKKLKPNQEINNNLKCPEHDTHLQTKARKRWKLLANVLRKNSEEMNSNEEEDQTTSVRRFKSFDLMRQYSMDDDVELSVLSKLENWYTYKINIGELEYAVNIHHMDRHITAEELMGFNNTGNVCVWPSEEALAVYVLSEIDNFNGKWILELGGGMTCLCALVLAKYGRPYAVHLTDGNTHSVENVKRTICLNELSCYTKCSTLKWEDVVTRSSTECEKFDYILSADCLFFDEARSALVDTIWFYLSSTGTALVMAPRRGNTLSKFVDECKNRGFSCGVVQKYSDIIWKRHLELKNSSLYDEDIHYPVLIKLFKNRSVPE